MKNYEKESFLKSFLLFFLAQTILVSTIFLLRYDKDEKQLTQQIFSQMRICSYSLTCKEFIIDFVPKKNYKPYKLYLHSDELSSYFPIQGSQKNYLKIALTKEKYIQKLQKIQKELLVEYIISIIVILLFSLFFSFYTLRPLRDALKLTEEFIKDILHDFNTPLSTLRLNVAMLHKDESNKTKIQRIENAVNTILQLQTNLRSYLYEHKQQQEIFNLERLIQERIDLLKSSYALLNFIVEIPKGLELQTNKDAFIRIIDNLLSNAAKYNKKDGFIKVTCKDTKIYIEDSGKGIKEPTKVFNRFYKEQERGIGIGLHIVAKLAQELGITIEVQSEVGIGTTFILDLKKIML